MRNAYEITYRSDGGRVLKVVQFHPSIREAGRSLEHDGFEVTEVRRLSREECEERDIPFSAEELIGEAAEAETIFPLDELERRAREYRREPRACSWCGGDEVGHDGACPASR